MLGGHHASALAVKLRGSAGIARCWVCLVVATVAVSLIACGGGKPAATPTNNGAGSADIRGLPDPNSADWCEPMPDLGEPCEQELKQCAIVCDYISDTCALLVCVSGTWDYVERGGEASAQPK